MERKDIIWQAFIGKNPTNDELYRIIYNAPEEYKAKAREIQEIRDKNKDELLKLMLKE